MAVEKVKDIFEELLNKVPDDAGYVKVVVEFERGSITTIFQKSHYGMVYSSNEEDES